MAGPGDATPIIPIVSGETADRQAARLAAIDAEIKALVPLSIATPYRSAKFWWQQTVASRAPFVFTRRKTSRFRLPRSLKANLIDRFCADQPDLRGTLTTLVVVAHPDDESIGAGARLRQLGDAYLVSVTDGAPRDLAAATKRGFNSREEYAEARAQELLAALAIVGLPNDRLICLNFIDGDVTFRLAELCLRLANLIDSIRPTVIVTHPYEGGHTDHDATAFAVHLACGALRREGARPPAILELASYFARDGSKVKQEFLPHERADRDQRLKQLTAEEKKLKQRIFECFGSQRRLLQTFSTEFERFRPAPRYVFTEPPHSGVLNYERYGHPERGQVWRELAREALENLRMRKD